MISDKCWRVRLTGWDANDGQPRTLHFTEFYFEPTKQDIESYVRANYKNVNPRWKFITVEVQIFYNVQNLL